MEFMKIAIGLFIILESLNVMALYFSPDSKHSNSVGIFKAWEKSKKDPEIHNLVRYLVNWVAGVKLIFISLVIVIAWRGDEQMLFYTGIAMILSILSFFWRLFPLIRTMDEADQITPKNYSTTLGWMIFAFVAVFMIATFGSAVAFQN